MKLVKWMMVPAMLVVLVACNKPAEKPAAAETEKVPTAEKPAEQPK